MATPNFVVDNNILWLEVPKKGTPAYWTPNTNYKLGDTVIPTPSFALPPGKDQVMFQCVGFVGKSGQVEPSLPITVGNKVIDNNIEWVARDPEENQVQVGYNEYYQITQTLTLT